MPRTLIFMLILAMGGGAVLAHAQMPLQPEQARPLEVLSGLQGVGFALAYGDREGTLIAACDNGWLMSWTKPNWLGIRRSDTPPVRLQGHIGAITALAWNGTSALASGGGDGKVILWNMPSGTRRAVLSGHRGAVRCLSVSPDGKTLASAGDDLEIHLWDIEATTLLGRLAGHSEWVMSLAFSADGKLLASGGYDQIVRLWRLDWRQLLREIPTRPASPPDAANYPLSLAFSLDQQFLAVGGTDPAIRLFSVGEAKEVKTLAGHSGSVTSLVFHPGGSLLVSGSKDRTVRLWNPATGQMVKTLEGHQSWVLGTAVIDRGSLIASIGADQTVRIWDLRPPAK